MCNCKFYNGDSCSYEDYASGQSEDGYCMVADGDGSDDEFTENDCDCYTEDDHEDEEEKPEEN